MRKCAAMATTALFERTKLSVPLPVLPPKLSAEKANIPTSNLSGPPVACSKKKKRSSRSSSRPPATLNIRHCRYKVLAVAGRRCGWDISWHSPCPNTVDWDVYWTDAGMHIENVVRISKPFHRINHFPGMVSLYRKHNLAKCIRTVRNSLLSSRPAGALEDLFSFFPRTWLLPMEREAVQAHLKGGGKWVIVKPASSSQVSYLIFRLIRLNVYVFMYLN